jgi:hypothetical protein
MSIYENHPFHIVNKRPRPLAGAIGAIVTLIGILIPGGIGGIV